MDIGKHLRQIREAKKLSQGDIEKRTGLLRCYLSRVECGHTVPSVPTLEKLAKALSVPLWEVMAGIGITATPAKVEPLTPFEKKLSGALQKTSERDKGLFLSVAKKLAQQGGEDGRKRQASHRKR